MRGVIGGSVAGYRLISADWWLADSAIDLDFEGDQYFNAYRPGEAASDLVFLLHGDGALYDSTGKFGIGVSLTDTRIDTAQSKFGGQSVRFENDSAILIVSDKTKLAFGTGDFTIDFWVRYSALSGPTVLIENDASAANGFGLFIEGGVLKWYNNSGTGHTCGTLLSADTWYHVAVTRASGTTRIFLNGTEDITAFADTNSYVEVASAVTIGTRLDPGWIDEYRILKGTAAWTANFTPPSAPYTPAAIQSAPSDPLAAQTVLMLHMNGADGSANFSDSTGRHFVQRVAGAAAEIDTAQSKFGGSSYLAVVAGGGYLSVASSDFTFGTGDFTVDAWYRFSAVANYNGLFDTTRDNASGVYLYLGPNGGDTVFTVQNNNAGGGNTQLVGTTPVVVDTWYHVAVVRSGGTIKLYVNGVSEGTPDTTLNDYTKGIIDIGTVYTSSAFDGWIDEFRVIKGVAAWTANFTPPTAPYDVGIGPYDVLSCTRASGGYAQTAAGTLTQFVANQLRITDLGLLVEDARTNVCPRSQEMDNSSSGWSPFNLTYSADAVAAPDGTTTADKLIASATATAHVNTNASVGSASGTWTWSAYFKSAGYNYATLTAIANAAADRRFINIDLVNGTITDAQSTGSPTVVDEGAEVLGNGWVRAWITLSSAAPTHFEVGVSNSATPTWNADGVTFTGDASSGIYAWGTQLEAGVFPSSYIPTTTASAARAADVVAIIGALNTVLSASEASLVADLVDFNLFGDNYKKYFEQTGGNAGIMVRLTPTPDIVYLRASNGDLSLGANMGNSVTLYQTGGKIGGAWSASGRSVVGGGGTVATDAEIVNGIPNIHIGESGIAVEYLYGYFRRITAWTSRLADATLQALTSP